MLTRLADVVRLGFSGNRPEGVWLLVIGDLMLDRYLWGRVERISPEAPVPVLRLERENYRAGGAANVAANLAGLGLSCRVLGTVGDDEDGARLVSALRDCGVGAEAILAVPGRTTTAKTRIIGGHQQILRLDREDDAAFSPATEPALVVRAQALVQELPAAIILSDYAKGLLGPRLCRSVIAQARACGVPVLVDPKGRDYDKYRGATVLTPNRTEALDACRLGSADTPALLASASRLKQDLDLEFLVITLGEEGAALIEDGSARLLPATAREVFDVSGAGDTVIATLAAGLVGGLTPSEALSLANLAAGIVVGKVGTVPVSRSELLESLCIEDSRSQADKISIPERLSERVAGWRARGERIVFTNGCFDLLHAGHVTYLEQARQLGDRLVVGLNTDRSVRALKGEGRPVIHEHDRARVLAALESVDAVVLFDEDTPLSLIELVRPDVLVKGADYSEDRVVGARQVKSWGGQVVLLPLVQGRSTSGILAGLDASGATG
jgi:D-beta-D-heptose 7-phosphate kinase/D-beta-D-heptose 1-phosphate adenosyltransferase